MFKHLLVPLDGSNLAEAALPYAAHLAAKLGATVTLIHVIESHPPQAVHGSAHLTTAEDARRYLDDVAMRAFPAGVMVARHVHTSEVSEVARSIVDHASEFLPDLIVMCTHGSGGLRDLLYGSIAQQVISLGRTPVLLVPPVEREAGDAQAGFICRCVLVPLDGAEEHEQGIPVALDFARLCESTLHLLVVVRTLATLTGERAATGRMLPGAMAELLRLTESSAVEYLRRQMERLQPSDLAITAEVARGEPAKTIVGVAQRIKADLIVLGTHGKSGMDAFWQGSIAPRVSSQLVIPLLLVPLRETAG